MFFVTDSSNLLATPGKTLAYLLPIMDDILQRKRKASKDGGSMGYDYGRALILVPNKELVQQVVRMAMALSGGLDAGGCGVVWKRQ